MQTEQYREYIRSEEWKSKAAERIALDQMCVMCHRPLDKIRKVQVHHITYERLGHENIYTDLCTLCGSCHAKIHNYYNRRKKP